MKARLIIVVVLVAAAAFAGRQMNRPSVSAQPGRQVTRESYRLDPGARVEVRGINGPVEVRTAETDTAEVNVVSEARDGAGHEGRRVVVDYSPSEIVVRTERRGGSLWAWLRGDGEARQEVKLVLPRNVEFAAKGVNGPVTVGEVEGSVEVSGVNGRVEAHGVGGHFGASGVNGGVKVSAPRLAGRGMDVNGVNGNVEILLGAGVGADIEVHGHNGQVTLDLENVTSEERESRRHMRARVGAGGAEIGVNGVNGNVRFGAFAGGALGVAPSVRPALAGPEMAGFNITPPQPPAPPRP